MNAKELDQCLMDLGPSEDKTDESIYAGGSEIEVMRQHRNALSPEGRAKQIAELAEIAKSLGSGGPRGQSEASPGCLGHGQKNINLVILKKGNIWKKSIKNI